MRFISATSTATATAMLASTGPVVGSSTNSGVSLVKALLSDETKARRLEARADIVSSDSSWKKEEEKKMSMTFLNNFSGSDNDNDSYRASHNVRHGRQAQESASIPLQGESEGQMSCDAAFLKCLPSDKCVTCFLSLETDGIDWATVKPETPCSDVVNFLLDGGYCADLKGDQANIDSFCNTFDSCVVWEENAEKKAKDSEQKIDCDSLNSCYWEGMHLSFLGDGICHHGLGGCYNHAICDYDGGDCCEDTCKAIADFHYVECGGEGYKCKDPKSVNCNKEFTDQCEEKPDDDKQEDDKKKKKLPDCGPDEAVYRIVMYDSFGDGWDATKLALSPKDDPKKVLFEDGLEEGSEGMKYICLNMESTCYHVNVNGGVWGNEVSWEIKPLSKGSPAVAGGGAPMDCEFSVGGEVCLRTCDGKPNLDPMNDSEYTSYKQMYQCIENKCVIQMGACKADKTCEPCLNQITPEYCYANDNFNAVVDCGLCHCIDEDAEFESDFCEESVGVFDDDGGDTSEQDDDSFSCSASETLRGSSAVMAFSKCTDMDQLGMMVTDFDENNFGSLDDFEKCAHEYQNQNAHGGHTAMQCMQILQQATTNPTSPNPNAPMEAIKALANSLYHDAESFCDCAKRASDDCPLCPSFMAFKTLLFETLDACQALDEIDCDAWNEFYTPCKANVVENYGSVDFRDANQCKYVQSNCGDAGTFPAFRKLDCGREIPKAAWDFYTSYNNNCIKNKSGGGSSGTAPVVPPPPAPRPNPPPPADPKPAPVHPSDNQQNSDTGSSGKEPTPKPYVPSGGKSKPYKSKESKKGGHGFLKFLFFCALCGGGYYLYKQRSGSFEFVRYRRAGGAYTADSEMYSSLSMDAGSSSFEPPTLPPTPMETMT